MRPIRVELRSAPGPYAADAARIEALAEQSPSDLELSYDTLRIYRPGRIVSFGPRDLATPGYIAATEASRALGFDVAERRPGGRPMAFHEQTLIFDWLVYDAEPRRRLHERFEQAATIICAALSRLGLDARVGAIPGEYCPGQYSVNVRGAQKVAGLAQRVYARAAHVGAAIVVADEGSLRDVLLPVYEALELPWEPATLGSVRTGMPTVCWENVARAVIEEFVMRFRVVEGQQ